MRRHRIDFTVEGTQYFVLFGWNARRGFWAELRAPDEADPLTDYGVHKAGYRDDAAGLLEWVVQVGALDARALDEALIACQSAGPVRVSPEVRRVLDLINALKREAD